MENWKPVVGHEGLYEVSSLGSVRSLDKVVGRNTGTIVLKGAVLRPHVRKQGGYHTATLYRDRVKKTCDVHVLVATAFHGPCPDGLECCHGDGDPGNNAAVNLRWDTHAGNVLDRVEKRGEAHHSAKLSDADVVAARLLAAAGAKLSAIAKIYGVTYQLVWGIVRRNQRVFE